MLGLRPRRRPLRSLLHLIPALLVPCCGGRAVSDLFAGGAGGAGGGAATGGSSGSATDGGLGGGPTQCTPASTTPCYTGPDGTLGVGACQGGLRTCNDEGTAWGGCVGEVTPTPETCATPEDDDCDGKSLACGPDESCDPATGQCKDPCANLPRTSEGCEFYATVTANAVNLGSFSFGVAVTNRGAEPVHVEIGGGEGVNLAGTVAPASSQVFLLPWVLSLLSPGFEEPTASVLAAGAAYRIRASRPVSVVQMNPIDEDADGPPAATVEGSLLLPRHAWSTSHRVVSRATFQSALGGTNWFPGFYAVVAGEDGTLVTVSPGPKGGQVVPGGGVPASGTALVPMNRGDVLQVFAAHGDAPTDVTDLTGTLVTSTKPVQVLGGHKCSNVPTEVGYCDHLEEVMWPVEAAGRHHVVLAPRGIMSSAHKARSVRIVALEAVTSLVYEPPQPGAPASILGAGDWVEFTSGDDFEVEASSRVLVAQFRHGGGGSDGDPAMVLAVPAPQWPTGHDFFASVGYASTTLDLVVSPGTNVTLDGAPVSELAPVGATGYLAARIGLAPTATGSHRLTADGPVAASVYGAAAADAYWYPTAAGLEPLP